MGGGGHRRVLEVSGGTWGKISTSVCGTSQGQRWAVFMAGSRYTPSAVPARERPGQSRQVDRAWFGFCPRCGFYLRTACFRLATLCFL